MKVIKKAVSLASFEYYLLHLNIINNFLPIKISVKEMEILACYMMIDELIRFEPKGRRLVKEKLNLSDGGLSNHMRSIKNKGLIINLEGEDIIIPILFPDLVSQYYQFKITNNDI